MVLLKSDIPSDRSFKLIVNKSFTHLNGIEKSSDFKFVAALLIKAPEAVLTAPKTKRSFNEDQIRAYNETWIRSSADLWFNYDAARDLLNIAIPDGGNDYVNSFTATKVSNHIMGRRAGEVNYRSGFKGRDLQLPSNRSREFVFIQFENASKRLTIQEGVIDALRKNLKQ